MSPSKSMFEAVFKAKGELLLHVACRTSSFPNARRYDAGASVSNACPELGLLRLDLSVQSITKYSRELVCRSRSPALSSKFCGGPAMC
jgi:hypothetical protein